MNNNISNIGFTMSFEINKINLNSSERFISFLTFFLKLDLLFIH